MTIDLLTQAESLVRSRITGHRKGLPDVPTSTHSFRVSERLRSHGFSEEVCLAGLLHDVVEDGGVTLDELRGMGFSDRVVTLVGLCSHDVAIPNKDARWVVMMAGLVRANDLDAWAIKLADITDNIGDAHAMPPERRAFMIGVKAPLLLRLTADCLGTHALWRELHSCIL